MPKYAAFAFCLLDLISTVKAISPADIDFGPPAPVIAVMSIMGVVGVLFLIVFILSIYQHIQQTRAASYTPLPCICSACGQETARHLQPLQSQNPACIVQQAGCSSAFHSTYPSDLEAQDPADPPPPYNKPT
ncbi:hypothetical protein FS749_012252 [Ceratobasidium sp. UAMH 11750]|nr:hypothetical protein FS749_012252 [Ceratobasidium sp. UAMH 11750]